MMKRYFLLLIYVVVNQCTIFSENPFRFAFLTDLHINVRNGQAAEDLRMVVDELNASSSVEFVLVGGDIADKGDSASLVAARSILNRLKVPFHIVSGNHDIVWDNAQSVRNFAAIFGGDSFVFQSHGYVFAGFATSPSDKAGRGVARNTDLKLLQDELRKYADKPVFFITHYPLLEGDVENRTQLTDMMKQYKVKAVLCGHYHRNTFLNFDGIPGIVNRSTLRSTESAGGYTLYTVSDTLTVAEKKVGTAPDVWIELPLNQQ